MNLGSMSMLSSHACSSSFLAALNRENHGCPPVWLMRQAGRYLPEYRKLRSKNSLYDMFHCPEIAAKVTMQPIERFGMDAAILFADILLVLELVGIKPVYPPEGGAHMEWHVNGPQDFEKFTPKPDAVNSVYETIRLLENRNVPLIGFSGGPLTVASYAIEKGHHLHKTKEWLYRDPKSFHELLQLITDQTIIYLRSQVEAGVDALQIFDSWAGLLGFAELEEFSLPYLKQLIDAVDVPVIIFMRGSSQYAERIAQIKPAGISLDWGRPPHEVRRALGPDIALQGNLDPSLLHAPREQIAHRVRELLETMKGDPAFIFGLGHGMLPDLPVEGVSTLIETVRSP
ncbi:MAG: uroporphyrinogen decarboxylase [Simkaniaceae bacterium]|nr:uroporphyrinogen decarboxylase [Simkaniaceae bacterium]